VVLCKDYACQPLERDLILSTESCLASPADCCNKTRKEDLQQYAKITVAPENNPPEPTPAKALPIIKALLLGAVAQTRELEQVNFLELSWLEARVYPSSNRDIAVMKVNFIYKSQQPQCEITILTILTLNMV
jgi:hypothetical protein